MLVTPSSDAAVMRRLVLPTALVALFTSSGVALAHPRSVSLEGQRDLRDWVATEGRSGVPEWHGIHRVDRTGVSVIARRSSFGQPVMARWCGSAYKIGLTNHVQAISSQELDFIANPMTPCALRVQVTLQVI